MPPRLHRSALAAALTLSALTACADAAQAQGAGSTFLTSGVTLPAGTLPSSGSGYDNEPTEPSVSGDGRYVAFVSTEDALAPGANPDVVNIFRKDRLTGTVELVSRTTGAGGTGLPLPSGNPVISEDGARVAFTSVGAFDPADTDDLTDVYVRDLNTSTTTLATPGTTTHDIASFDLSGDGNWIAFETRQSLVGGNDTNALSDVYRRNLTTGTVALASAANATIVAQNGSSFGPAISDDGRWVAFTSAATTLIAGFTANAGSSVFARDLTTNLTTLVSAKFDSATTSGNGSSNEPIIAGQPTTLGTLKVAYRSDATNLTDNAITDTSPNESGYVRALSAVPSTLVTRATGAGGASAASRAHLSGISDDGKRVVFGSDADNLGAGADYYGAYQRSIETNTTTLISADNAYAVNPALASDGSYAVWVEFGATPEAAPELPGIFGRVMPAGTIEHVSRPPGTAPLRMASPNVRANEGAPRAISGDGRYVVFAAAGAGLGIADQGTAVYRRDLRTNALEVISRSTGASGAPAAAASFDPAIDAAGNRVVFATYASLDPADTNTNADIYVRDVAAGTTTLASRANGVSGEVPNTSTFEPSISADGNRVVFRTAATNLGAAGGNAHVYVRDLAAGTTTLADRATGEAGAIANQSSSQAQLSADGRLVAYRTLATNLSADDAVGGFDIYVRDLTTHTTTLVSRRPGLAGAKVTGSSFDLALSSDGSTVVFRTGDEQAATEAGPWGGQQQLVARKIATGANTLVSRAPGGAPSNQSAEHPSVSANGDVVAFSADADNLLPGLGGGNRDGIFVRTISTGTLSGPPAFGLTFDSAQQRAIQPSISDDGQCVAFIANGHNAITGAAGDFFSTYVYVNSGSCPKPEPVPAPTPSPIAVAPTPTATVPSLSKVSVTNRRFKVGKGSTPLAARGAQAKRPKKTPTGTDIAFTLNTTATVRVKILRRGLGRKVGKQCLEATPKRKRLKPCQRFNEVGKLTRDAVGAGAQRIAFSGRLGKKKLPVGSYQAVLVASTSAGSSKPVTVSFTIVAR